jgi:hypothetical protein
MSALDLHEYFPYDSGPGANSTELRWRKMAQLWAPSGVLSGGFAYSNTGDAFTVQPGVVWLGGQYGELTSAVTIGTSSTGWLVFRNDTLASKIELVWSTGPDMPADTPTVFYEPLLSRAVVGGIIDRRRWIDRGPIGLLVRATSTAIQTGIPASTWTDLTGLTITYTIPTTRRIRVVAEATYAKSSADGTGQALIAIRNASDTELVRRNTRLESGSEISVRCEHMLNQAAGTITLKASAFSFTSWLNTASTPTMPAQIYAEDLGRAF